jgi:hypothetical protein
MSASIVVADPLEISVATVKIGHAESSAVKSRPPRVISLFGSVYTEGDAGDSKHAAIALTGIEVRREHEYRSAIPRECRV